MIISPLLISVIISILLLVYLHKSFKRNFVAVYSWPMWIAYLLDALVVSSTSFRFVIRMNSQLLNNSFFTLIINLNYVLLGFIGLITILLLVLDFEFIYRKFFPIKLEINHDRRDFFKKSFTLTYVISSTVITGLGYINSFDPKVKKVAIKLKPIFQDLAGLKIAQISDVHIGPTLKKEFTEKLVKSVNELKADLIVITGDLIDGDVASIGDDVRPLQALHAPLGVFYITGNHEYYWNGVEWIDFVNSLGIKSLINENIKLSFNNNEFYICGVTDLYSKKYDPKNAPDYKKAKQNIPDNAYKILLAHQPKACFESVKEGYNLQLSGHTHGGQGFPWNFIVYFVQPYIKGLYNHEGMDLYVNTGTGFWGPPNRFLIDSEITLINFT